MINWVISLLRKSFSTKIHVFCLDFSSAMLANVIHTPSTIQYLEKNHDLARNVFFLFLLLIIRLLEKLMENLLKLVKENIPVSVLMHLLICLSYLSKENFSQQIETCNFVDRISEFVEHYSQINTAGFIFIKIYLLFIINEFLNFY